MHFLAVPLVGLQCAIVTFHGHTHLFCMRQRLESFWKIYLASHILRLCLFIMLCYITTSFNKRFDLRTLALNLQTYMILYHMSKKVPGMYGIHKLQVYFMFT